MSESEKPVPGQRSLDALPNGDKIPEVLPPITADIDPDDARSDRPDAAPLFKPNFLFRMFDNMNMGIRRIVGTGGGRCIGCPRAVKCPGCPR
jgi:hypothetical protein